MSTSDQKDLHFNLNSQHEFYVLLATIGMCIVGFMIIMCTYSILRRKYPKIYWRAMIKIVNNTGQNNTQGRSSNMNSDNVAAMNDVNETTILLQENINNTRTTDNNFISNYTSVHNYDNETIDPLPSDNFHRTYHQNTTTRQFIKLWFSTLLASNSWIYNNLGLDTLVLITTIRLFLVLSSMCSFFNLACVIPINIISNTAKPINTTNIISRISINNIPRGSSLLWVHLILLYAYTILMYLLIFYFWKNLVYWKQRYFIDNSLLHRSFIIQNLPTDMVNETNIANFLRRYINLDNDKTILYVFKNSFHFVKHLKSCDKKLYKLSLDQQQLLASYSRSNTSRNSSNDSGSDGSAQFDVSKMKMYSNYIEDYQNYVNSMNALRYEVDRLENVSFALVSFCDIETAHTLAISDVNIDVNTQNCILAPEPNGIQYRNFIHSNYTRLTLKTVVWISTMVFVMFWTIPFSLISQISNSINYPQFNKFKNIHPDFGILLQSVVRRIIPMTLLMIFYLVLPFIMQFLSLAEGHISKMIIDMSVFIKFSIFHIINTYFVFLISETLLVDIQNIIEQPLSLSNRLIEGLPHQANFFTAYIVFFTLIVNPYELLQFVPLIKYLYLKGKRSEFYMNVFLKPFQPNYPHMYSRLLYIFGIGISQSLISPILTMVWNIYFFSAYATYTYMELFINRRTYSYRGLFWISTINWMTVYIIIFQLLMIGLFTLKEMKKINFIAIPLPIITMVLHMLIKSIFTSKYTHMTLETLRQTPSATRDKLESIRDNYDIKQQVPKKGSLSCFALPKRFRSYINSHIDIDIFNKLQQFCNNTNLVPK